MLVGGGLFSCRSFKNTLWVRKPLSTSPVDSIKTISTIYTTYLIQTGDILSIEVSSFKPEVTNFFNEKTNQYVVQDNGYIYMPFLDSIKVAGISMIQVRNILRDSIKTYAPDARIMVKLLSFKITLLGEVRNPGQRIVSVGDRLTIFDALGLAGDVTEFGNMKRIKIIRPTGKNLQISYIDITNESILTSKFYFIQPNDVVYVEPEKLKTLIFNVRNLSLFTGFISLAFLVYTITRR